MIAQRRLRQLGMLAAIGATDRHLRLVVLANGVMVGVVAAIAGAALGLAGWIALAPRLESTGRAPHRDLRRAVVVIVAGMVLAVVTATAAAWWPARAMARVPITQALSARPPRPKPAHRSALAAVVFLTAGFVSLAVGIDAPRDSANGRRWLSSGSSPSSSACSSPARSRSALLAATASRLPLAARLALRDLARHQARSGAALAAISLGLGIAVAIVVVATAAVPGADEGNLSDRQVLRPGRWRGAGDPGAHHRRARSVLAPRWSVRGERSTGRASSLSTRS